MADLDSVLADLAKRGELTHVSVVAVAGGYSATFACASAPGGYSTGNDKDPVAAIHKAIAAVKLKRRSKAISEDVDFG